MKCVPLHFVQSMEPLFARSGTRTGGQSISRKCLSSVGSSLHVLVFWHNLIGFPTADFTKGIRYPLFPGEYGAQAVSNLSGFRSTVLSHAVRHFQHPELSDQSKKLARYDAYPVTVTCPPGQPMKLIGVGEGVKYACDLRVLVAPCLIYSFGSQGDFAFEADVLQNTSCEVHTFDCTYGARDLGPRHHYHLWCLGDGPTEDMPFWAIFKNYTEIVRELGHRGHRVDVLKMDIEGYEFQALSQLGEATPNLPLQILVEVHFSVGPTVDPGVSGVRANSVPDMSLLFAHLANLGYGIFSRADNLVSDIGCCSEFSLLRVEGSHVNHRHKQHKQLHKQRARNKASVRQAAKRRQSLQLARGKNLP